MFTLMEKKLIGIILSNSAVLLLNHDYSNIKKLNAYIMLFVCIEMHFCFLKPS